MFKGGNIRDRGLGFSACCVRERERERGRERRTEMNKKRREKY